MYQSGAGADGIAIVRYTQASGVVATGGGVTTDGTDTIHTFTSVSSSPSMSFSYTIPPPYLPPAPTNLATGAINSNQVNLEWTEINPTGGVTEELGLGQELGYKVYKSDYAYAGKNLPGQQGQDSSNWDGYIGATEMDDNELLFHFDGLQGQTVTTALDIDDIMAYYEMDASTSALDGTVNGAITTATDIGNWAGSLGQAISIQTGTNVDTSNPVTMNSNTPTEYTSYTGNTAGATCDANTGNWQTGTTGYSNMYIETSGGWCVFPALQYDITNIPSGSVIQSIDLTMDISLANSGNTGCSIYDMDIEPSTVYTDNSSPQDMVEDMLAGNKYVTDDNFCTSTGTKTVTLNSQANTDLTDAIANGQSWFGLGFYFDDLTKDALPSHKRVTYNPSNSLMEITYAPSVPVYTDYRAEQYVESTTSTTTTHIDSDFSSAGNWQTHIELSLIHI